jgi:regulatory protein
MRPVPSVRRPSRLLDAEELWNYALKLLSARALSAAELKIRLQRKAAPGSDVAAVLQRLQDCGWLDDEAFADSYASARRERGGWGPQRILRELAAKRVSGQLARQAVEKAFAGADEVSEAERFLERKFRGQDLQKVLSDERRLAAAYRRLRYAGFSGSAATAALKIYSQRAEELSADEPESR